MTYDIHPVAKLFPLIEGKAFADLVADIKDNGLLEAIEYQGNTIIDGRNRLRACEAAGVVPQYRELPNSVDPVKHILQRNIHRRHLTTAQRAAIAAELPKAARGGDHGNQYTGGKSSNEPLPEITNEQAAELLSVHVSSVKRAKARMKDDPEAHAAIKRGEKPPRTKKEDDMKIRLTIRKLVLLEYAKLTGEVRGPDFAGNFTKQVIMNRLPWVINHNLKGPITDEQADQIRCVIKEYINATSASSSFTMIEAAQAEAETIKQEIVAPEKNKLERAIKAYEKVLDLKLEQRIKQHMDEILPMYSEEYDRYKAFNDTYSGVFSEDEFRLLISVLHPDRCQPERATQFAKAFHLIKSKEEVLCKVKPNDRPASLPSSLEELIARRRPH